MSAFACYADCGLIISRSRLQLAARGRTRQRVQSWEKEDVERRERDGRVERPLKKMQGRGGNGVGREGENWKGRVRTSGKNEDM